MRLIFIMKEEYKKSHEMRRHSLFNFTSLRIALLKTIWKDIVGKFSIFGKEIYQKKEKKKEIWMFESGSTGWQVKIGQIWTGEGGLKIGNNVRTSSVDDPIQRSFLPFGSILIVNNVAKRFPNSMVHYRS